jgi:cytochrome b pre-mRNA-processing protein 3
MFGFFRRKNQDNQVAALYANIVKRARHPSFYKFGEVNDTFDGRFELLSLHVHIVLRDLRRRGLGREAQGQALFDTFFQDLDQGLRESGVGDMGISKKIRRMAEAFYGRAAAYDDVMIGSPCSHESLEELTQMINRNFFDGAKIKPAENLAAYVIALDKFLSKAALDTIISGQIFVNDFDFENDKL